MKIAVLSLLGLITLLFVFLLLNKKQDPSNVSNAKTQTEAASPPPSSIGTKAPEPVPEKLFLTPEEEEDEREEKSALISALNRPETSADDDVRILKKVFFHYRTVFKTNPVGTHQDIVRKLTGGNVQGIAYLPKSHPAIVNDQLLDRWGSPFYFHQISGDVMEVRSAGPDKRHWNDDDITIR